MKRFAIIVLCVFGLVGFLFTLNDFSSGNGVAGAISLLASTVAFIAVAYFS